jgi:hypothetical protein
MYKNFCKIGIALLLFLTPLSTSSVERIITLKTQDGWVPFREANHITLKKGYRGENDIVLKDTQYTKDGETDLIMHFNTPHFPLEEGYYSIKYFSGWITTDKSKLGEGSGYFRNGSMTLTIEQDSMFSAGTLWGDFSIEFWLYPMTLSDGEQILHWQGYKFEKGNVIPQEIDCTIQSNRLKWSFKNIFSSFSDNKNISLTGINDLIPKKWSHHLLRFDSETGLLEYGINNIPAAITYTTETSHEGGNIYLPQIGISPEKEINLFFHYTGFIDEVRIKKEVVDKPNLNKYSMPYGHVVTESIDTGGYNSKLLSVETVQNTPDNTSVKYFYRISDVLPISSEWTHINTGEAIQNNNTGRFIEIMIYLYPNGEGEISPEVSQIQIVYEPDLPPPPPTNLRAKPKDSSVVLSWRKVIDPDVKGYLVYYGTESGQYFGSESGQGPSPIDVGNTDTIEIQGLENGRVYYFAVSAYGQSIIRRTNAPLSIEVSARPINDP